jgi:penicillin-binding protein 1A|tara:strand:- start:3301 stop:5586 length:2286 start_codon:yes stop_codon:yes gene_type:complete
MSKDKKTVSTTSIWIKRLWKLFALAFLLVISFFASVRYGLFGELPDTAELENPKTKLASEIYAGDGNILGKMFYQEDRTNSEYANLPEHLKVALVATEDERFYGHSGIDGRALLRAITKLGRNGGGSTITQQLAKNLFHRDEVNRTNRLIQKIKEWFLSVQIEKRYAKEEIIVMYFNTVPYGRSFGIKSASKRFFNKKTQDLTIEESAVLVGMLRANTYYNPIRNPNNATRVRNVVFGQLENYNYITTAEKDSLKKLPLVTDEHYTDHNSGMATYFRSYLAKWMKAWTRKYAKEAGVKYNIYDDGLRVYTTLDTKLQEYAEKAVSAHMEVLQGQFFNETKRRNRDPWYKEDNNGDMVSDPDYPLRMMKRTQRYRTFKKRYDNDQDSIDFYLNKPIPMKLFSWQGDIDTLLSPMDSLQYTKQILHTGFMSFEPQTGHIKAWVGGIDHRHFQYDHVNKKSSRQVGSTFKPLVYARGLDDDKLQPCEKESTGPVIVEYGDGKEWMPKNAGDVPEEVTFYEGLQKSINTITARVMKRLGPNSAAVVRQTAGNMGIDESKFEPYPSICLGTMDISVFEMVGAYGTFVNEGTFVEPIFITRIEDKHGNILEEFTPKRNEAIRKQSAYIICKMLERVTMSGGTAARLRGSRFAIPAGATIGGKTGTTQNNSDGWFMGITPNLVSGCWVGAEERNVHFRNTRYGQGANMALPIFGKYMEQVYANQEMEYGRGIFKKPDIEMTIELDCDNIQAGDSTYVPMDDVDDEELF